MLYKFIRSFFFLFNNAILKIIKLFAEHPSLSHLIKVRYYLHAVANESVPVLDYAVIDVQPWSNLRQRKRR